MEENKLKNEMPKAYESSATEDKYFNFWTKMGLFNGIPSKDRAPYSIAIPPPNITGMLTMGHVLNNTLQDILNRWRKMQGRSTCWFPGTDHAGIATEARVEKYLRENEGSSREKLGREEFIRRVWQWKEQYGGTIVKQLKKIGSSCDWERERFTMDKGLSDAVIDVFVRLYDKGYIYRGKRMINWCPVSKTALSDEEVIYKEVHGYFYHFKYPLSDKSGYLQIATTRPETMLGDTALAVNPNDDRYKHLIGKTVDLPLTNRSIPIVADQHANPEFGTGCVKITPAHDPNDFQVALRHNLDILNVMNPDATMNEASGEDFVGLDRFECREKVVKMMDDAKLLVKVEDHVHSVGFSERENVEIEPRISEQWFVNMKELAKPAIEAVKSGKIRFHPDRWTKTYYHWMENIKDWCISRQIWWGHRIPAWYHKKTGEVFVGKTSPPDIENWRQEEDVLDTWFSSWLWPFSIMGWPEKTDTFKFFYPTNDLVTGPDIIFFWVARMIMAGIEFTGEVPFRNVYFTSIIRDDQGRKLSKSLGNSPDPLEVISKYGADSLRFSIIYIAPVGMDIRYSNEKCELGRNFCNKLWNSARFRKMQGGKTQQPEISKISPEKLSNDEKWILGRYSQIAETINESLENFRFHDAAHSLYEFIRGEFCDWFIECQKQRFNDSSAKEAALIVFDYVFFGILRLLHPFMPFITEELCHQLEYLEENQSIMLESFPTPISNGEKIRLGIDKKMIELTSAKFAIISTGRKLRTDAGIAPSQVVRFCFKPMTPEIQAFLEGEKTTLEKFLRASEFSIADSFELDGPAPSVVLDSGTIFLPLKGLVDIEGERAKLEKQKTELEKWINGAKAKLENERFTSKAPPQLIEETKKQLVATEEKLRVVEENIKSLG
ncbi:MAG TPA: valine--tRNA ligase [Victivallales bacterium]|nr:valine--tRNA ligase [Victivallales bacterium]